MTQVAPASRTVALVLEYEGTDYSGFQRQANAPSVQAALEEAYRLLTGTVGRIRGAGRTDAGVHAMGQVVAFDTTSGLSLEQLRRGLNHFLPDDIAVRGAQEVDPTFDPRRNAISRIYWYTLLRSGNRSPLLRRTAYRVEAPLDPMAMGEALGYLEGVRDFAPFCGTLGPAKSTVRQLFRTAVCEDGEMVRIELEGTAFLPQQVRRMVGAALQVGLRKQSMDQFKMLADSGVHGAAHRVLPPQGLCLREVKYRTFSSRSNARQQNHNSYTAEPVEPALASR